LAYNGKFAQLVGKFHANEEEIEGILGFLPTEETIRDIQINIHQFSEYQSSFHEHFDILKEMLQDI